MADGGRQVVALDVQLTEAYDTGLGFSGTAIIQSMQCMT